MYLVRSFFSDVFRYFFSGVCSLFVRSFVSTSYVYGVRDFVRYLVMSLFVWFGLSLFSYFVMCFFISLVRESFCFSYVRVSLM